MPTTGSKIRSKIHILMKKFGFMHLPDFNEPNTWKLNTIVITHPTCQKNLATPLPISIIQSEPKELI
jgi:hypothetical protein